MTAPRECAFCNQSAALTREHVWPRCIIERTPSYNARYLGKNEKFFEGDLTVRDVCASCNNGVLSALDDYICQLFDAQFSRIALARQSRTFIFNFSLLLRWLLKASYNSARANQSDVALLARFAPFVLGGDLPPDAVEVRLELIHPSKNPNYRPGGGGSKEIPPQSVRCCRIEVPNNPVPGATIRLVAINSFYFWLIFWPPETDPLPLQKLLPGTSLSSRNERVRMFPSRGMLELHSDWMLNPRARQSMKTLRARKSLRAQNGG